ncbi:MAG: GIY-YIG nuclease family protein [Betaproteobacteria bacterium]|nr:GIY-YIG nuclease family protein [Betaproteobacteria bacterium]
MGKAYNQHEVGGSMTAHIYIIRDGDKTKIRKSTNLERRLPAYKTHNPNHEVFRAYPCSAEQAHRIELFIKQAFKDKLAGQGKEWFSVPAEEMDRFVRSLLEISPATPDAMPSLLALELTHEAHELLDKILTAVEKGENSLPLKNRFAELFSKAFGLGIPRHKLPEDLLAREYPRVDLNHSASPLESKLVRDAVTKIQSHPHSNHCWNFFHLLKLSSGHAVAVCTAEVSMPYMETLRGNAEKEVFNHAKELGMWATFHHDWSWWYPGKTSLILWQPKTLISQLLARWDKSFRKWVMERRGALKFEDWENSDALLRTIDDVCDDKHFPLEFGSYELLQEKYLGPFWHFLSDAQMADHDYEDDRALAMRFLVGRWIVQ